MYLLKGCTFFYQGHGREVRYPQFSQPGLRYHTTSYYLTIILAQVTLHLTDTNTLVGDLFGAAWWLTIPLGVHRHRNIYAARNPMAAWNRGITRATDPQPHCKQKPLIKGHNPYIMVPCSACAHWNILSPLALENLHQVQYISPKKFLFTLN